jgi:hypothetical protein
MEMKFVLIIHGKKRKMSWCSEIEVNTKPPTKDHRAAFENFLNKVQKSQSFCLCLGSLLLTESQNLRAN